MQVVTAIYGGYDWLKPHPTHDSVTDWICYTDDPQLRGDGWEVRYRPLPYPHPRMGAKWWKCHPPEGRSLWVDGSVEIVAAGFIDVVDKCLSDAPVTMWRHPWRDCIFDEVGASAPMVKYHGLPLERQVAHYARLGWTQHRGLWASTVIGWNGPHPFGAAWFSHCELATYQDQLSLPPLLDRYGVEPEPLPGVFLDGRWVHWHGHESDL